MAKKGERRDPTRLLREEKMRKRIAKDLPKLEAELRKVLAQWEDEYGRPFLVHGLRYLDELERTSGKAPPPRSKTPSIPANPAPAHKKSASVSVASKASSVRGGPPPRSKTPSALGSATLPRNAAPPSVAHTAGAVSKSPSRIPARAPLSNLQYGNNSPPKSGITNGTNNLRKMAPPARLPPPKMGELFSKSTMETPRPNSAHSENVPSSGLVRHVAPEDVYDDRDDKTLTASSFQHQAQFTQSAYYHHPSISSSSSSGYPSRPTSSNALSASTTSFTRPTNPNPYAMAPPTAPYTRPNSQVDARQISNTSTASSALSAGNASGSENWETYSSASDAEYDGGRRELSGATDDAAYYARLRAQASQGFLQAQAEKPQVKRSMPDGGWASPGGMKKARGLMAPPSAVRNVRPVYVGRDGSVVEGSEAGWTDDGDEGF